eukprot:CAMPEP_0119402984 /NCGR_PEP_ID=MMETSP1334-20130426/143157_1 /TAXON_ID=127549 /ORGANISM="Calcidiscus leptoporus, Strain RCC1130" /LENGTH=88 /DNA_ID=CAMNT_0007426923 /DNA_START=203 /DNA_END=470 /DNA_ORIENTATION=-
MSKRAGGASGANTALASMYIMVACSCVTHSTSYNLVHNRGEDGGIVTAAAVRAGMARVAVVTAAAKKNAAARVAARAAVCRKRGERSG